MRQYPHRLDFFVPSKAESEASLLPRLTALLQNSVSYRPSRPTNRSIAFH